MNSEADLLKLCIYFKGEGTAPDTLRESGQALFWDYEKRWFEWGGQFDDEGLFEAYGLTGFEENDGVPLTLKKLLFARHMHWNAFGIESVEPFKEWYISRYRAGRKA